jgi:hypothetical protein
MVFKILHIAPARLNIAAQCLLYSIQITIVDGLLVVVLIDNLIMRIQLAVLMVGGLLLSVLSSPAMDRWSALSMIESGDDDRAIGPGGEVSRFQIRPELWPGGNSKNDREALTAAQEVMKPRLEAFETESRTSGDRF